MDFFTYLSIVIISLAVITIGCCAVAIFNHPIELRFTMDDNAVKMSESAVEIQKYNSELNENLTECKYTLMYYKELKQNDT
jgi:hypothetical protein